jgi:AhpD family alkylhydroperoxidase
MDEKIKELIAIGASVTGHCQSCLEYHIKEATRLGVSSKDIHMAIAIGKSLEKGASKVMDNFVKEKIGTDIKPQSNICCVNNSTRCSK